MTEETKQNQSFHIERHGDIAIITPSPEMERMPENLMEQAAQIVLAPLRTDPPAGLIFDLSRVDYVGSVFLSFLFLCYIPLKKHGTAVALAGANDRARELLQLTGLEGLWPTHATRDEGLKALGAG